MRITLAPGTRDTISAVSPGGSTVTTLFSTVTYFVAGSTATEARSGAAGPGLTFNRTRLSLKDRAFTCAE